MKFVELKKSLMSAPPKPCYLVTGDDAFVVRSAVNIILSLAGQPRELNYSAFGGNAQVSEIIAALMTPPMLSDCRVVKVSDFSGDLKGLKEYLDNPCPTSVLLFTGALTANFNAIIAKIEVIDCNKLDAAWLAGWAVKKAAVGGTVLHTDAATVLVEYCNRDMNRINNELTKLIDFADGGELTANDVKALVTPELEFKVFELSEAIAAKNKDKAVVLTDALLADNNSPVSLLSMLFNHFRRLLFVALNPTSDTLASELKVKEYAVKVALKQSSHFTVRRLKAIFDRLCGLDSEIKSGLITDRNALISFVCETVNC